MAITNKKTNIQKPTLIDIDVYDRKNFLGETLIHSEADAVNNAITTYLVSKRGFYLYSELFGSPLDILEFKNLDILQFTNYGQRIASQIEGNFGRFITDVSVTLVPQYETQTIEITLQYLSLLDNVKVTSKVVKRATTFKYAEEKTFIDITLDGNNLVKWVELEVLNQPKSALLYDAKVQSWVWSVYKLVNLTDPNTTLWKDVQEVIFEYNSKV